MRQPLIKCYLHLITRIATDLCVVPLESYVLSINLLNMDEIIGVTSGSIYQPTTDMIEELGAQQEKFLIAFNIYEY